MRRMLMLLVLMLIPALAMAEPATPYAPETMLRYPLLTEAQQALFDLMYQAAREGTARVELPQGTRYDDAAAAVRTLMDDCPELVALNPMCSIGYLQNEPEKATYVSFAYDMPLEWQEAIIGEAQAWAEQAEGDDFARECALHDRLCAYAVYDPAAPQPHNAWGALMDGRAVCDGYAKALTLLLRLADIPCSVVYGQVATPEGMADHAWNIMLIDGAYTQTDITNNDQSGLNTHWYLNLTDADMGLTHVPDADSAFPACTDETLGWYVRTGRLIMAGPEEMEAPVMAALKELQAGGLLNLRFAREDAFAAFMENISMWLGRFNAQHAPQDQLPEGLRLLCEPQLRCVVLALP